MYVNFYHDCLIRCIHKIISSKIFMLISPTQAGGILCCVAGIIALCSASGKILECERSASSSITCKLTSFSIFGRKITIIPSGCLQSAQIQRKSNFGVSWMGYYFRIILLTNSKAIPLSNYSQGSDNGSECDEDMQEKVHKINEFINDSTQKLLNVEESIFFWMLVMGGCFLILGIFMTFFIGNNPNS
jgi:hypothetical protein